MAEDGAWHLFEVLVDGGEAHQEFAENYYERVVRMDAVQHVHALNPLTQGVVSSLNPLVGPADLAEDVLKIGYLVQPIDLGPKPATGIRPGPARER